MTKRAPSTSSSLTRVLVVEDEADLQELLRYNLERAGYDVTAVATGEEALSALQRDPPDLVLLDLMLPGMGGLDVCRAMRHRERTADLPVIIVTAKGEEADVVAGLELGADDYITKPFSPRVLMARVKAVLRRQAEEQAEKPDAERILRREPLMIHLDRHLVYVDDQTVDLTATEFKLLTLLARRPGRVYTRQQIIEKIHGGHTAVTDRSVDVQVVAIRRKLGAAGELIQTIRGVGYRFKE